MLADLGLDPAATPPLAIDGERLSSIDAYRANTDVDEQAFLAVWEDILVVVESIEAFVDAAGAGEDAVVKEVLRQFLSLTSTEYVRLRWPTVFFTAKLLGVVEDRVPTGFYAVADGVITTDVFDNLLALLEAPFDHFGRVYSTPEDDAGARALANETLLPLAILLAYWDQTARHGVNLLGADVELPAHRVLHGWDGRVGSTTPLGDHLSETMLSFSFSGLDVGTAVKGAVGATLAWVPCDAGGPGLFVSVNGSVDLKVDLGSIWKLNTKRAGRGSSTSSCGTPSTRRRRPRPRPARAVRRSRAVATPRPPTVRCPATSCSAASRSASRWPRSTPRRRTRRWSASSARASSSGRSPSAW